MFAVLAFVLFVIAAVLAFLADTDLRDVIGLIAAGLACLALAGVPVVEWVRTRA